MLFTNLRILLTQSVIYVHTDRIPLLYFPLTAHILPFFSSPFNQAVAPEPDPFLLVDTGIRIRLFISSPQDPTLWKIRIWFVIKGEIRIRLISQSGTATLLPAH